MGARGLAGPVVARLAEAADKHFADGAQWQAHLARVGVVAPFDPMAPAVLNTVRLATEGAVWGGVKAYGFLPETVIVSDDAGQFDVGRHALCWVHAEWLVHKLEAFTELHRAAQAHMRGLIWWFYSDLGYAVARPVERSSNQTDQGAPFPFHKLARPEGFEPPTCGLEGRRSIRLS